MVQIIQRSRPSFGEQLAAALGQAIGGTGAAYFEGKKEKERQKKIDELVGTSQKKPAEQMGEELKTGVEKPTDPFAQVQDLANKAVKLESMGEHNFAVQLMNQAKMLNDRIVKEQSTEAKITAQREKDILPIQQKAIETGQRTQDAINAVQGMMTSVRSGDVSPVSFGNLATALKKSGFERLGESFETQGSAVFKTSGKEIFSGAKDIFGSQIRVYEAQLYNDMLAQVGRQKEVNEASLFTIQVPLISRAERSKETLKIIRDNPGISPIELNNKVSAHMEEFDADLHEQWIDYLERAVGKKEKKKGHVKTPKEMKTRSSLQELHEKYG